MGHNRWRIIDIYQCPNANVAADVATFWDTTITGLPDSLGTDYTPVCVGVDDTYKDPGNRWIRVEYVSPTWQQVLINRATGGDNSAVLLTRAVTSAKIQKTDPFNQVIGGVDDTDPTGQTLWDVVKGNPYTYESDVIFRVHAIMAYDAGQSWCVLNGTKPGTVNSDDLTGYFGDDLGGIGKVLLAGVSQTPLSSDVNLAQVDFDFLAKGENWNTRNEAGKFEIKMREIAIIDANDEDTGRVSQALVLVATGEKRDIINFTSNAFSTILGMTDWAIPV